MGNFVFSSHLVEDFLVAGKCHLGVFNQLFLVLYFIMYTYLCVL